MTYEQQEQIRQEILDAVSRYKAETGCTKIEALNHILVLDRINDPYAIGTLGEGDIICAEYAYTLWKKFCDETGETQVHIRGLHYYTQAQKNVPGPRIIDNKRSWTIYEHTDVCYQYLSRGVKKARYLDLIPFDGIKDERNDTDEITVYRSHDTEYQKQMVTIKEPVDFDEYILFPSAEVTYDTFDDYLDDLVEKITDDLTMNIQFYSVLVKPFHIELWCEKTLPDYIKRIPGIDVIVEGSGCLSQTIAYNFISRLKKQKQDGVVFYLSDFDPKGNTMPVEMARKIQYAKKKGELEQNVFIEPVAITKELIQSLGEKQIILPPKEFIFNEDIGKKRTGSDTMKEKFMKNKAEYFIELQALEAYPEIYREIIRNEIKKWEADSMMMINMISDARTQVKENVKEHLLDEIDNHREQLEKWFDETVELAEEIEESMPDRGEIENMFTTVNSLFSSEKNKKYAIMSTIDKIIKDAELPEIEPPRMTQDPPVDDYLFDSRRDDDEQVRILKHYKDTGDKELNL